MTTKPANYCLHATSSRISHLTTVEQSDTPYYTVHTNPSMRNIANISICRRRGYQYPMSMHILRALPQQVLADPKSTYYWGMQHF